MARMAGTRLVVGLIVVVAVAVGGFFLRDITPGNVTDLKVGDCFDLPADTVDSVAQVQHHRCTEPHTGEIVGVLDYPAGSGDAYPGHDALRAYATTQCVTAFMTYTGRDPYTDPELTVGWFLPLEDGWSNGDHGISCHLFRVDAAPMTQSFRASS